MKRTLFLAAAFLIGLTSFAQSKKAEDILKFKEMVFDFGKIKQSVPVTHDFVFSNESDGPVVIESAVASCGCTTPVKPEAPVSKGAPSKIGAGFNAVAAGPFNKTITVKVAGIDMPLQLRITGEVLTADAYAKYQEDQSKTPGKSASK